MKGREKVQHILIVDDNPTIVELVKYAVNLKGSFQISSAQDGTESLEMVRKLIPDLIILNDKTPAPGENQLIRTLRSEENTLPILMLTPLLPGEAGQEDEREIRCLQIGCDDLLYKPFKPLLLPTRVEALLQRKREMFQADASRALLSYADIVIDTLAHTAHRGSRGLQLTLREHALLTLFLRHPQQVLEHAFILQQVWGYDYRGGSHVVDVYVEDLRTKLEAQGEARLIQTISSVGYVLEKPGEKE